jgi:hypothetical protein
VRHSNDALELAHGTDDAWTLVLALITVMMTRGNTGDLRGGIQAGHELLELARRVDRPDMTGQILNKQAWLLIANGDLAAARAVITEAMRLYKSQADPSRPLADRFANHYGMTLLHNAAMAAVLQRDDTTAAQYITAVLTMPVPDRDHALGAIECAALIAVRRRHFALALTLIAGTITVGHPVHSLWVRHLREGTPPQPTHDSQPPRKHPHQAGRPEPSRSCSVGHRKQPARAAGLPCSNWGRTAVLTARIGRRRPEDRGQ